MRSIVIALLVALIVGCDDDPMTMPTKNPPQVFLTVDETNVIGKQLTGKINTSGCKNVAQVQLLQNDKFLTDVPYEQSPQAFTLTDGVFATLYSSLGIAASITLKAKVVCDDGRTNNSTPVGVKFFPIDARFAAPTSNSLVVPLSFVAEGGFGGTPNTFIGCTGTETGTTIVRSNLQGEILNSVGSMPFDCSVNTQITEMATGSGYRWVMEPGAGAFALKMSDFSLGKVLKNDKTKMIGAGSITGIAVVWTDDQASSGASTVRRLSPDPTDSSSDWNQQLFGFMNSTPRVLEGGTQPSVWISRFEFDIGTKTGTIVPYQYDLNTGTILNGIAQEPFNGQPSALLRQQFPIDATSQPIIPQGYFATDGLTFVVPLPSNPNGDVNSLQSTVISCSTAPGLCENANRRWTTQNFPGLVTLVTGYSADNIYAAAGPYQVYFLNAQLGTVLNLNAQPLRPSGTQAVAGLVPGNGTDFYVMTGPVIGGLIGFPTEIITVDSPQAGELWRLNWGSGEAPLNAMSLNVDLAGTPWIRVGTDLVRPLSNGDYRTVRGPTR